MNLELQGKRAIVTGGSRGIGLAIAKALAAEGCGVGLIARGEGDLAEAAREIRALGAHVAYAAADVTDAKAHDAALERLVRELGGGVEIAVANAGGSAPGGALDASDDVWRGQWELNFLSAARLVRGCAPHMERAGYGSCVVVSSISGLEAFGRPAYVAAKAALHGFVKSAAQEGAPKYSRQRSSRMATSSPMLSVSPGRRPLSFAPRATTIAPSASMAPTTTSGCSGRPTLRTSTGMSGACSASATGAPTCTPARGTPKTMAGPSMRGARSRPSWRPASTLSW